MQGVFWGFGDVWLSRILELAGVPGRSTFWGFRNAGVLGRGVQAFCGTGVGL